MYVITQKVKSGETPLDDVFSVLDTSDNVSNDCTVREIYSFLVEDDLSIKGVEIDEENDAFNITCYPEYIKDTTVQPSVPAQTAQQPVVQPAVYETAVDDDSDVDSDDGYDDSDEYYDDSDDYYDAE